MKLWKGGVSDMKFGKILCGLLAALLLVTSTPLSAARTIAVDSTRTASDATPPGPGQTASNPTPEQEASNPTPVNELAQKMPVISRLSAQEAAFVIGYREVPGAKQYEISYSTSKTFKSAKKITTSKLSYRVIRLKDNKRYYVKVRAWNGTKHSQWSNVKSIVTKPVKVNAITKLKLTPKKGKVAVSFRESRGAYAYEIQYSTKRNMSSAKVKKTKKTSVVISQLKSKKTYYIRVRAYKVVDGVKYDSKWSTIQEVKTK